jgi:hypothetical protein
MMTFKALYGSLVGKDTPELKIIGIKYGPKQATGLYQGSCTLVEKAAD